jgi:hypothetical protein
MRGLYHVCVFVCASYWSHKTNYISLRSINSMEDISPLFTQICAQNISGSSFSLNNTDLLHKQEFLLTQQWHHKQHYIWHNAELQFL